MWFILAFLTAILTSFKDAVSKKILTKENTYIVAWAWPTFALIFLVPVLLIEGIPEVKPPFYTAMIAVVLIFPAATLLFFKAIESSDLSLSVPMLTFTPLFQLITSPLIIGEFPRPLGLVGILLIVAGSYLLHFQAKEQGLLAPFKNILKAKGPRYILIVALLYSIGSNFDKIGVINSSPTMWLVCAIVAVSVALAVVMIAKTQNVPGKIRRHFWPLVLLGLLGATAFWCQMNAIRMTLVPYVIAIKRTSVMFTSLWGFLIFKEKGLRHRGVGIAIMVLGAALILFSHQ